MTKFFEDETICIEEKQNKTCHHEEQILLPRDYKTVQMRRRNNREEEHEGID